MGIRARTSSRPAGADVVPLSLDGPVWDRVFTVAPLVLVGTREPDGRHDLAPKHMATPLGWRSLYGFVCTTRHATLRNVRRTGEFTVSFPEGGQAVQAALAATKREPDGSKESLAALPTFPARAVDGVLVAGCYLFLECRLERVVEGLDDASLVVGRIVAAAAREDALRGELDDADVLHRLPPLTYVNPGRFAAAGETFSFPFPAAFGV